MVLALARSSEPWCFPAGSCFFSKLFYCQQYCQQLQATESRQKGFFSRISAFFEAVLLPVAAFFRSCSTASSLEKGCFSRISDDTLGSFFHVVLALARPSELWCFHAGSYFFSKLFYCLPAAAFFRSCSTASSLEKGCFSRISDDTLGSFFHMVLALARPSELWCFHAGSYFFSKLFYCLPAAAFFRSCSTASSLEKGCFSRISDDTLGSFFTWFWHSLVLQSHGVFLPVAAFFRSCSTASSLEKGCFSRISDDTLGSFFTWFWHSLVLQSHGVFLPAAAFFRSCSTVSSTASSYKQQNLVKKVSFLGFQLFSKLVYCQLRLATESLDLSKNAVFLGF